MDIIVSNPHGRVVEADLSEFEARIGYRLPDQYREFLLVHNGALVEPRCFWVEDDTYSDEIEGCFYGLHDGYGHNFKSRYLDDPSHFPKKVLPIADDGMGNYICIGLEGSQRGRILFYDHERHWENNTAADLEPLADSFENFLSGLFEGKFVDENGVEYDFPATFNGFVSGWRENGVKPSSYEEIDDLIAFIVVDRGNEPQFALDQTHCPDLLDDIIAGANRGPKVDDRLQHGVAVHYFDFRNRGTPLYEIGVAEKGFVVCDGYYWTVTPAVWETLHDTAKEAEKATRP